MLICGIDWFECALNTAHNHIVSQAAINVYEACFLLDNTVDRICNNDIIKWTGETRRMDSLTIILFPSSVRRRSVDGYAAVVDSQTYNTDKLILSEV